MKLVEILARDLSDWPEACKTMTQDADGDINMYEGNNPKTTSTGRVWLDDYFIDYAKRSDEVADDHSAAIVTRAQWQAERDRQNGGEWKRHRGGKCPIHGDQMVEVKLRDGDIQQAYARCFAWPYDSCDTYANIMQYRVISQPQAEEVSSCGPFLLPPNDNSIAYDIEFPSGVVTLEAKTDQIDGPIKWRDTVNELDAYIEKYTRERDALIERLALEGFALLPAMTPVMGVAEISIPYPEWEIGDIIEVVSTDGFCDSSVRVGDQYPISHKDSVDVKGPTGTFGDEDNYKFIRRP